MMGRRILIVLSLIVLSLSMVSSADGYGYAGVRWEQAQRYRFWGRIGLSYRDYTQELNRVESGQSYFSQDYSVGASGYVWRPKFMIFSSELTLGLTENKDDFSSRYTSQNIGFMLNTVVFPRTEIPLIVSAGRNANRFESELVPNRDFISTYFISRWSYPILRRARLFLDYSHIMGEIDDPREGSSTLNIDTFIVEISGSDPGPSRRILDTVRAARKSSPKPVSNDAEEDNEDNENNNANTNNNNSNDNNANVRAQKTEKVALVRGGVYDIIGITSWGLHYQLQKIRSEGRGFTNMGDSTTHRLRLFAHRPVWVFTGYGELDFYKSEGTKSIYGSLSLSRETAKFMTYNSISGGRTTDSSRTDDTASISSSNTYWYTRNLSFNGGVTYERKASQDTTRTIHQSSRFFSRQQISESYSLSVGANYYRYFTSHLLQAYLYGGFSDSAQNNARDTDSGTYATSYGLKFESFPKVFRTFSYYYMGELFGSYHKDGMTTNRSRMTVIATKQIRRFSLVNEASLHYNFSSRKDKSTSKGFGYSLKSTGYLKLNSYTTLSASAEYAMTNDEYDATTQTLAFRENLTFVLYRRLMFSIGASQWETKNSNNSRTSYRDVLSSLDYQLRKLLIHGEFNFSSQEEDRAVRGDSVETIKKRTIFLRVTRPFGR